MDSFLQRTISSSLELLRSGKNRARGIVNAGGVTLLNTVDSAIDGTLDFTKTAATETAGLVEDAVVLTKGIIEDAGKSTVGTILSTINDFKKAVDAQRDKSEQNPNPGSV